MKVKTVYVIMSVFNNFEDWNMNYADIDSVFTNLYSAKEQALDVCLNLIHDDMEVIYTESHKTTHNSVTQEIRYQLNRFGYVDLKQKVGNGETRVHVIEKVVL